MPSKTSSRKEKGRKLQKYAASLIKEIFDLQEGDAESRPLSSPGEDVMMSPLARERCPISIEAKSWRKNPSVRELNQSRTNAPKETLPVVVWKPHGKGYEDTMVMANLREFLEFIDNLQGD